MIRQIALLTLRDDAAAEDVTGLEEALETAASTTAGIAESQAARHLEGSLCAHYTWDAALEGPTAPPLDELLSAPALAGYFSLAGEPTLVSGVDAVRFAPQDGRVRDPGIRHCIKRTLFVRVFPETAPDLLERFEADIMRMPDYIPSIRNWAFSRTDTRLQPTRWTHVWEQEYDDLAGLQAEYMLSPFHWGLIDGWFDPECPQRIVENRFAHVFCEANSSVLAWSEPR